MMMRLPLLLVFVLSFTVSQAQFNQEAPWMKDVNAGTENRTTAVNFQNLVDAFNAYWETRDPNVKGSGFKPFKRWEYYWQNFVNEDGKLPSQEALWSTWETTVTYNQNNRRADESNWLAVGPFSHTNTGSWSSGQGRVNAIAVDPNNPNTYYSGAPAGGLWKSTDAGLTWTTTTDALPQIGVSGIAIDPSNSDIIYIATGDDDAGDSYSVGVMKSTDGGQTWATTDLNSGNSPTSMNDIYIHPSNSNILWVATSNGVYKTTDAGTNWRNTNLNNASNGTVNLNIRDIKIHPTNPDIVYAVSPSRFYKSTDGGENFSTAFNNGVPFGASRMVIDVTPANPEVVYLVAADNTNSFLGLYKSTDSGENFSTTANQTSVGDIFESNQSWYDLAMAVSDTNETEVYVGVLNVWKTSNSGNTFEKLNNWNAPFSSAYTHADIHLLRFFNGDLYAGTDGGFYKSTDAGSSFTDLTEGMQISQFYKIAVSKQSSSKMVGGLQDNGGHAFNNNQWQNYFGADGMDTAIDPNNSDIYYGFTQFGGSLNISSTSGGSLDTQVSGPDGEDGNWVTPLVMNSESELYSGYSRLYKLVGGSWSAVSNSFGTNIDKLEIDDINPDHIFVATNNTLHKSTDRGLTFSTVENFSGNITSIEIHTNNSDIVYVTTGGTASGNVYQSNDGGLNFTNITGSLPSVTKNVIKHQNLHANNPLFLGTSLGVYRYDDVTSDWEPFNNDMPNVSVTDLEINIYDNIITASTYGRGIWQSALPLLQATNDIELVDVLGVTNEISCDTDINTQVVVENKGQNTVNNINVSYTIDGNETTFNWTGSLASNTSVTIDIPVFTLDSGSHDFIVTTTTNNDQYAVNNSSQQYLLYANETGLANDIHTFENDTQTDEFLVIDEGSNTQYWEQGVPSGALLNSVASGTQVYGTNLNGQYADATKSYLVSPCYDISNLESPELAFYMAYDLEEDWDIVYVEYSSNSGETWTVLGSANDPNWYNSNTTPGANCLNCPGAQWTGTNTNMLEYVYDLSGFNLETNMLFRIVFHSDQAVVQEGVIVDDFVVRGTLSTEEFTDTNFSIYPNPSNGIFNITMKTNNTYRMEVIDISGKRIIPARKIETRNFKLDLSNYASGMYFLKIQANNSTITKKLIKN